MALSKIDSFLLDGNFEADTMDAVLASLLSLISLPEIISLLLTAYFQGLVIVCKGNRDEDFLFRRRTMIYYEGFLFFGSKQIL